MRQDHSPARSHLQRAGGYRCAQADARHLEAQALLASSRGQLEGATQELAALRQKLQQGLAALYPQVSSWLDPSGGPAHEMLEPRVKKNVQMGCCGTLKVIGSPAAKEQTVIIVLAPVHCQAGTLLVGLTKKWYTL